MSCTPHTIDNILKSMLYYLISTWIKFSFLSDNINIFCVKLHPTYLYVILNIKKFCAKYFYSNSIGLYGCGEDLTGI